MQEGMSEPLLWLRNFPCYLWYEVGTRIFANPSIGSYSRSLRLSAGGVEGHVHLSFSELPAANWINATAVTNDKCATASKVKEKGKHKSMENQITGKMRDEKFFFFFFLSPI